MRAIFRQEIEYVPKKRIRLTRYGFYKVMGIILVLCGILFCAIFPEDAGAGILLIIFGVTAIFDDFTKYEEDDYDL